MVLYHGSDRIVQKPLYGFGPEWNDYGRGFYCTENLELAKEWACRTEKDGFANRYYLDTQGLNIVHLQEPSFHILNWIAVLLKHRRFNINTPVMALGKEWLLEHYLPDLSRYDVIIGYRADDSYFSFARTFLANGMTVQQLERAMRLGKLGEQAVIISEKAFQALLFDGAERADGSLYYPLRTERDRRAREGLRAEILSETMEGLFLADLMRGREYHGNHG